MRRGRAGRHGEQLLGHIQQVAAIAVRHGAKGGAAVRQERERLAGQSLRTRQQRFHGVVVEAAEDEHLAAGEQGAVQGERGVLGGGADEHDRAVLDDGEKTVLLGTVEAVDFVHEEKSARPALARRPASSKARLRSATPENTAESGTKCSPAASASRRAMLVLPTPGGPQRIS